MHSPQVGRTQTSAPPLPARYGSSPSPAQACRETQLGRVHAWWRSHARPHTPKASLLYMNILLLYIRVCPPLYGDTWEHPFPSLCLLGGDTDVYREGWEQGGRCVPKAWGEELDPGRIPQCSPCPSGTCRSAYRHRIHQHRRTKKASSDARLEDSPPSNRTPAAMVMRAAVAAAAAVAGF